MDNCTICLDSNNTVFVTTTCNHTFHEKCLTDWKNQKSECPLCRTPLTKDLIQYARDGDFKMVEFLLENGADISKCNDIGNNALIIASLYGHFKTVKLLLKHGADISARNESGQNALYKASLHGHFKTAKVLLQNGADISFQHVIRASEEGHSKIVALLCKRAH